MRNIFFIICLLNLFIAIGQSNDEWLENSIILALKEYNLKKTDSLISVFKNEPLKKAFLKQFNYNKHGKSLDNKLIQNIDSFSKRGKIIVNYLYGDYMVNLKTPNDSLAFYHYRIALNLAKEQNDTILINECLQRVCGKLFHNGKNLKLFSKYLVEYKLTANDSVDDFWVNYYQIAHRLLSHIEINKTRNSLKEETLYFDKGFKLAKNSIYFTGLMHQLKGVYYDVFTTSYLNAENEFTNAILNFEKIPYFYAQKSIYGNKVNLGIAYYNQKRFDECITIFKEALNVNGHIYSDKEKMYIHNWLNKTYQETNEIDSAYLYSKKASELKDKIDKYNHSIAIKSIDEKSNVKEKEKEIVSLSEQNKTLSKKLLAATPFILVLAIATIVFFFFYTRYRKKNKVLEKDQLETVQKIEELKSIVIKNHIILKDKTKIYISNLIYIKSDDHYLRVYTSDGKNNFVRGKLSKIQEELPPNFIRSHRSYIVNKNFIKKINNSHLILIDNTEIPISRSFKDNI